MSNKCSGFIVTYYSLLSTRTYPNAANQKWIPMPSATALLSGQRQQQISNSHHAHKFKRLPSYLGPLISVTGGEIIINSRDLKVFKSPSPTNPVSRILRESDASKNRETIT